MEQRFIDVMVLINSRMNKAKTDSENSCSDMEYNRAIGVYYEYEELLLELKEYLSKSELDLLNKEMV